MTAADKAAVKQLAKSLGGWSLCVCAAGHCVCVCVCVCRGEGGEQLEVRLHSPRHEHAHSDYQGRPPTCQVAGCERGVCSGGVSSGSVPAGGHLSLAGGGREGPERGEGAATDLCLPAHHR